ncbi:MAG: rRNA maturation RNase YbeY [Ilumatobacter sp.]|uniref:rRNA maturation RNase YbeY n=1 Tax=Ilumatobacter sp. TaxID=1967498 RepID=UPI00391B450F
MTAASVVVEDARSDDDSPGVEIDPVRWQRLAAACLGTERAVGELTLTFIDEVEIAELNLEHMGIDGATDVLSFPMDDTPIAGVPTLLGDIVISPAVAERQFADHAGTLDDELALLVVHGVLHVLGHDHAEVDEAATMRSRELALLEAHHWAGPAPSGFRHLHAD